LVHKLPAEMENKLFTAEQLEQSIKLKNKEWIPLRRITL
jgi:hypothetical protein